MIFLGNVFGTFFSYTFKAFAEDDTYHPRISDGLISVAASVGSGLVNGITRITMGSLTDKYSFKLLYSIVMGIQLFNSVVCFWAANSSSLFFICVLLNYLSLGGIFAVYPTTAIKTFGIKHGPSIYAMILIGGFCSSLFNIPLTIYLLPKTSFLTVYFVGSVATILNFVVLYFYEEKIDVARLAKYGGIVELAPIK